MPTVERVRLNHAIIIQIGTDGKHPLDRRTRRWICEACRRGPLSMPDIAAALHERGEHRGTGSIYSAVHWLADREWLHAAGSVTLRGKTSPLWEFNGKRAAELDGAIRRASAFRVDHSAEFLIVPTGSLDAVAADLADPDSALLWAMRTGDGQVPLIGVLDATLPDPVRDALVDRLAAAGVRRLKILEVLPREATVAYGARLVEQLPVARELASPGDS